MPSPPIIPDSRPLEQFQLTETSLLALCDRARARLLENNTLEPRSTIVNLLRELLFDEQTTSPCLDLETVMSTHLDKLVSDLLKPENMQTTGFCAAIAQKLERRWSIRFRQRYFDIDKRRMEKIAKNGILHSVTFNESTKTGKELWKAKQCQALSEAEVDMRFEPGNWWLNMACAKRDGAVGSAKETPTKGCYGAAALALLHGREQTLPLKRIIQYTRETAINDVPVSLMSQVGSPIRILRGSSLHSSFAPRAGIRYDGLYVLRQYGHKLNQNTQLHTITLLLERVKGQKSIEELASVPTPSQMDNWMLFEKHEGDLIKKVRGIDAFREWRIGKAHEKIERIRGMDPLDELTQGLNLVKPPCVGIKD